MILRCEWRHARKRSAENLVFLKKGLWRFDAGPGYSSWGWVDSGRCRNSHHSKNCVSLSSCRKTKLKKLINVSYLNDGESSMFFICLHQYILHFQIRKMLKPGRTLRRFQKTSGYLLSLRHQRKTTILCWFEKLPGRRRKNLAYLRKLEFK